VIKLRSYHVLVSLLAALFLLVQAGTWAHAAQYGDAPHEHDGVMCVVDAVTSEAACVLPIPPQSEPVANDQALPVFEPYVSVAYLTPPGRGPPPRSPPFIF